MPYAQVPDNLTYAERIARLPDAPRAEVLERIKSKPKWPWLLQRRRKQTIDWNGEWTQCGHIAARGTGKTAWLGNGAHEAASLGISPIGIMGRTEKETKDVLVHGETGIMSVGPVWPRPWIREGSNGNIIDWPNGVWAQIYSSEKPQSVLGSAKNLWLVDQAESYRDHLGRHALDLILGTLRNKRAHRPRMLFAANAYATAHLLAILEDDESVVFSESIYENADNLDASAIRLMERRFADGELADAELHGIMAEQPSGALWTRAMIEVARKDARKFAPKDADRIVIGVDPAKQENKGSDYTGIAAAGRQHRHCCVFEANHYRLLPNDVIALIADWAERYGTDQVLVEDNVGGSWVTQPIKERLPHLNVRGVTTNIPRRERYLPVSGWYGEGRVSHMDGDGMALLETEMLRYPAGANDDMIDAMAYAVAELLAGESDLPSFVFF